LREELKNPDDEARQTPTQARTPPFTRMTNMNQLIVLTFVCLVLAVSQALKVSTFSRRQNILSSSRLEGARNRAWAKGDLSDKDIFDEGDDGKGGGKKEKFKLDVETVLYEGPPSLTEIIFPAISILTIIGVVPFASAVSRQFWVKYKFTSRRISIVSGFQGKDLSEIIYPDIEEVRFVFRAFGSAGDMVLFLKDGAKVEMRHVPQFREVYGYVMDKVDDECKEKSMKMKPVEGAEIVAEST
jgi:hypothetical protein